MKIKRYLLVLFSASLVLLNIGILLKAEELSAKKYKEGNYVNTGSFRGGEIADGLDIKNIRWADRNDFERLVFDIYKWGGPSAPEGILPNVYPGTYEFRFINEKEVRVTIEGYRALTADIPDFNKSDLIKEIRIEESEAGASDTGFRFIIYFNEPVKMEVFELYSPARVVVDVKKDEANEN